MPDTFNGEALFGTSAILTPIMAPNRVQMNTYPGVHGLEVLDLASSGGTIVIEGRLEGATLADVEAAEAAIRTYQRDGTLADLHDATRSVTWSPCYVESFEPTGRIEPSPSHGFLEDFKAVIRYLG